MSAFAQWLYQHRGYHLLILALIYVVGVIGHDAFTAPIDWFRDLTSIRTLTVMMYVIVGVLFVGLNILFYRLWHQHAERRLALILWSLTICLALLFNFTIMPFKAELVHYIQYTIIGFLVVPWIKNFLSAIYLGSILGCLDEFYQYVGLGKLYFDYNDVILNLVGSALGVVFAFSVLPSKRDKFSHILVPTNGSELSDWTVARAVSFVSEAGARITFFYAQPDFPMPIYGEGALIDPTTPEQFSRAAALEAERILAKARAAAEAAGVSSSADTQVSEVPYQAIIEAVERNQRDLIFMASHGRRGLSGLLLGSETQKVLTHSKIPVLVYR